jgi:5-methylcytosine-specific restriction endonuclease McrA
VSDGSNIEWTDATLKYCWRCKRERPRSEFGRDRSRYDGRAAICAGCRKPPRQLPLIRETQADYERRRYAIDATYRAERRQHAHSRKRGVAPLPAEGMDALTEKFEGRCAYCPAPATTWDHLVPVSKGGRTIPGNIAPACGSCNSRKGTRDVYDFIEAAGIVISEPLDSLLALAHEWGQL